MSAPWQRPLPYRADGADYFPALAHLPWPVFLDSAACHGSAGRWDILTAAPIATLVTRGATTVIQRGAAMTESDTDPFTLLREYLGPLRPRGTLPFSGGALGWFGYDLGRRLEHLPERAAASAPLPDMAVGLYEWAVVVDHASRQAWLTGHGPFTPALAELAEGLCAPPAPDTTPPLRPLAPLAADLDRAAYGAAFARIQRYIREGDCYQVNLARCFSAPATGAAWPAYRRLRARNPAPFAAYLDFPAGQVLSASPERFLHVQGDTAQTRPIKGTRPRHADPAEDARLAEELRTSAKDRAENVMIVDLLRNDFGKVCVPGSVQVPELFRVESFATVHHLVSTVTGRLAPGTHALDLLRACFPGGSITGAPKKRAMEIIEECEPHRRNVYCGAIGYVGFEGDMDTSIAIRTAVRAGDRLWVWAGGGIVADSDEEAEFRETGHKAAAFMDWWAALAAEAR